MDINIKTVNLILTHQQDKYKDDLSLKDKIAKLNKRCFELLVSAKDEDELFVLNAITELLSMLADDSDGDIVDSFLVFIAEIKG